MKSKVRICVVGLAICASPKLASAAVMVTNTNDSGTGSLRAAITLANATPGTEIDFNITSSPVGNVWTIKPTTPLPAITANSTKIDGTTQTTNVSDSNTSGPEVVINGSLAGSSANGLTIGSNSCTVKGLVINGFSVAGISIDYHANLTAANPQSNSVQYCYLGTDPTGTSAVANGDGIDIISADYSVIGSTSSTTHNIISGNTSTGINLTGYCSHNIVEGNYIGTDRTGTAQLANHWYGIYMWYFEGSEIPYDGQNIIGGTASGTRNVISGNWDTNIFVQYAKDLLIEGNFIGTDVTGNTTISRSVPQGYGIYVRQTDGPVTIGGSTAAERNVIGDHYYAGIALQDSHFIYIRGNYVGVGPDGVSNVGNNGEGILTFGVPDNVTIGGTPAGYANAIYNNGQAGIWISGTTSEPARVLMRANSISNNGGLGIDLGPGGVNANDTLDTDTGPNDSLNFPVLTSATSNGTTSTIKGTLNSYASATFNIDFYRVTAADPSGYGEGRQYLGSTTVTTDASGNSGTFTFTGPAVTVGHYITATTSASARTSEFSLAKQCTASSPLMRPSTKTY